MLHNIRKFSKTFLAKIVLVIMIIPFVLWGMGGVFNSGNTNSVGKINNKNLSTQDFMNFIRFSNIEPDIVRDNLENNILEELLSNLVSQKLLEMEIDYLGLVISESSLAKNIKQNPDFVDDNNKFSRIKYEKFLLSSNLSAAEFEMKLKNNELQKKLFYYIGGGINTPFFITNKEFKEQENKIDLEYINLNNAYTKKKKITEENIKNFINENSEDLKEENIDFSYIKISPESLTGSNEYNEAFFSKIDEIENEILNGNQINDISTNYNLKVISRKNYTKDNNENSPIEKKIYELKENKIELFDNGDIYVLYQIDKINRVLPSVNNENFKDKVIEILYQKNKYEFNKKLVDKINENKFSNDDFQDLSIKNSIKIEKIKLSSISDDKKFTKNSIKLIYSMPRTSYLLVNDDEDNIYLVKILKINEENISKNSDKFKSFKDQGMIVLRDQMYSTYDNFINNKYKVKINQKTLERVKNYFK